jgi:hypothetical protein
MTATILVVYSSFLPSTKQIASDRNQDIAIGRLHGGIFPFDFVMPTGMRAASRAEKDRAKSSAIVFVT